MGALTAPVAVAAILMVVAGVPKVIKPAPAVGALRSVGVRVPQSAIRAMGTAEALIGGLTLAVGGRILTALVALSYLAFSAFLVVALRAGGAVASCGCVGRPDTPPTRSHLVVTATLVVLCTAAVVGDATEVPDWPWSTEPWDSALMTGYVAASTWCIWLVMAALPHLSVRRAPSRGQP